MNENVGLLKRKAAELNRRSHKDTESVNKMIEVAWELRYLDAPLTVRLSTQALQLASHAQYWRGRAYALRNIGFCQSRLDQYKQAEQTLTDSSEIFQGLNRQDHIGNSSVLTCLGITQALLSNYAEASESLLASLNLCEKTGDNRTIAGILSNLAGVYKRLGDDPQALDYYYRALQISLESNAPLVQAQVYTNLSDVLWRVGEPESSIENSQQAIKLFQQYHDPRSESIAFVNLGAAYQSRREYEKALDVYLNSVEIAKDSQNFETQAEAHKNIGTVYHEMGKHQSALTHLLQALKISQSINSRFYESKTLLQLGKTYRQLGNTRQSLEKLKEALDLGEQLNLKEVCYKAHFALSELYEKQGKAKLALAHHQSFYKYWQEISGADASRKVQRLLLQHEFKAEREPLNEPPTRRHVIKDEDSQAVLPPRKLWQVTEYVNQNLEQNITLEKLAQVAALSKPHFVRLFKRSTGKTPHQYLIKQRIERVKHLLQTTELPVTEIALRCGFSNQSHLTSQFRLSTNTTPHRFRSRS